MPVPSRLLGSIALTALVAVTVAGCKSMSVALSESTSSVAAPASARSESEWRREFELAG